jgi:hypothetical protein
MRLETGCETGDWVCCSPVLLRLGHATVQHPLPYRHVVSKLGLQMIEEHTVLEGRQRRWLVNTFVLASTPLSWLVTTLILACHHSLLKLPLACCADGLHSAVHGRAWQVFQKPAVEPTTPQQPPS